MISSSSTSAMLHALARARDVVFSSYILRAGPVETALEAAAERGAHVSVRLDGYLWGGSREMREGNRRAVHALHRAGADARLVHLSDDDGPGLHMKAAVCDGVAYLDDCNWNGKNDTVLRDDDRTQVRAIRTAALQQDVAPVGRLSLTKADALASEAAVIAHARQGDEIAVETEALHGCAISSALRKALKAGAHCRVLVDRRLLRSDPKTRASVRSLLKAGVDVRTARWSDKYAIAGSSHAWIGSADATRTDYDADRIEWSIATTAPSIVAPLRSRFDARWNASKALPQPKDV